uniref:Putative major capsid protein n=1 Tax=viral metagenome TaxID=1070528 RepID=A0A6M3IEY5_9ZZZZ
MTLETTTKFVTQEIRQFYERKMLDIAKTDIEFERFGKPATIPAREGKSAQWRRFEKITVSSTIANYTLLEGTAPASTAATISAVSASISQYGQWSEITDVLETQAIDPLISSYTEAYGEAMARGRDMVVRAEFSNATTIQYAGAATVVGTSGAGSVGSGNYLNAAEIMEAKRTLRRNGAKKIGANYVMFIHPDNEHDLFQDPDVVDAFQFAAQRGGANPLFSGEIGDYMGVHFISTNNLLIHSSYGMSGADTYECVMFGDGFYGVTHLAALPPKIIIHPRGTGGHTDPLDQKSTVGWKVAMAAKILNNDFGVLVHCASSRSNSA